MNRETLCGRFEKDPNAFNPIIDYCRDLGVSRLCILDRISADGRNSGIRNNRVVNSIERSRVGVAVGVRHLRGRAGSRRVVPKMRSGTQGREGRRGAVFQGAPIAARRGEFYLLTHRVLC